MIAARTDVVGSLLRPPQLLKARQRWQRGEIGLVAFKRIEDAAVDAAIRLQEHAGLAVVTDGEMRRLSFQSQLTEAVEGFSDWDLDAFLWGDWHGDEVGDKHIPRPPIAVLGRLRRRRFLSAEEFTYARGQTQRIVKVTLPSPSLFVNFYDPQRSRGAYPSLDSFLGDVAEILREEVDELVRLGCEYIQLDAPHYPLLLDPAYRDFYASRGWPAPCGYFVGRIWICHCGARTTAVHSGPTPSPPPLGYAPLPVTFSRTCRRWLVGMVTGHAVER